MTKILALLGVSALTFILGGCSSSAPSCSDSDVQELALEIMQEELQKSYSNSMLYINDERYQNLQNELEVNNQLNDIDSLTRLTDLVDELGAEWAKNIELSSIRTSNVNDELSKAECEGSFGFPGARSISYHYDAQYTHDGDLYVNVYGL